MSATSFAQSFALNDAASAAVFGKLAANDQDCKLQGYVGGVRLP